MFGFFRSSANERCWAAAAAASLPRLCLGTTGTRYFSFFLSIDSTLAEDIFSSLSQFSPFLNILQIFYHFPDLKKQRVKLIFLIWNSGTKPRLKYSSTKFNYKGEGFFPKAILNSLPSYPKVHTIFVLSVKIVSSCISSDKSGLKNKLISTKVVNVTSCNHRFDLNVDKFESVKASSCNDKNQIFKNFFNFIILAQTWIIKHCSICISWHFENEIFCW